MSNLDFIDNLYLCKSTIITHETPIYIYISLILLTLGNQELLSQEKSNAFLDKIKSTFSPEIKIGTHTFKDGSVYTGEIKGRKPHGKGKTLFKSKLVTLAIATKIKYKAYLI